MAERIPSDIQQIAQELDELQEKYTATVNQRALIEGELNELKRIIETLEELGDKTKVYRNVGNILFEEDRNKLLEDLKEKKEMNELLLERYRKEEEKLKEQIKSLQEKLKDLLNKYYGKMAGTALRQGASS